MMRGYFKYMQYDVRDPLLCDNYDSGSTAAIVLIKNITNSFREKCNCPRGRTKQVCRHPSSSSTHADRDTCQQHVGRDNTCQQHRCHAILQPEARGIFYKKQNGCMKKLFQLCQIKYKILVGFMYCTFKLFFFFKGTVSREKLLNWALGRWFVL